MYFWPRIAFFDRVLTFVPFQCHLETCHSDTPLAHEPADHTLVLPWHHKRNLCHAMMSAPTNWIMGKEKLADRAPSVQLLNPIFSYVRGLLAAVLHFSWKKPSFCWYPWNTPLSTKLPTFCCKINIESEQIDNNFELYDNWTTVYDSLTLSLKLMMWLIQMKDILIFYLIV